MYVCVLIDPDAALGRSKNELHLHLGTENISKLYSCNGVLMK